MEIALDASRPVWSNSLPPQTERTTGPSPSAQINDDQQRIISSPRHDGNRPLDFLKLVTVIATISDSLDQPLNAFETIVDVPLSACAGSKILGRGLSFEVILVGVGPGIDPEIKPDRLPIFVVYKKLRGLADDLNRIEKADLLRAALLEIRVLSHAPLRRHPNIINLIQLLWEPDPDLPDHSWPYAPNGTLATFQDDFPTISFALKKRICQDVGKGLLALHACDIVHGDLKSENVLICDTSSGDVIAKLADFGCAIADIGPSDIKIPAFTLPWNAPECLEQLSGDRLKYTDVYSFGLLVWRVALNGLNPFRCIDGFASLQKIDLQREVETLKRQDRVLMMVEPTLQEPFCEKDVDKYLILDILHVTVRLDHSSRDLFGAVALLSDSVPVPNYPRTPIPRYDLDHLTIIRELEALTADTGRLGNVACAKLFHLYMGRLEWPGARENAAKWFGKAMLRPHNAHLARFARDVTEMLCCPTPSEGRVVSRLVSSAKEGCYPSLVALREYSPRKFARMSRIYRQSGGFMRRDAIRQLVDCSSADDLQSILDRLVIRNPQISSEIGGIMMSRSGDLLIHAAARVGSIAVLRDLFAFGVDIDAVNNQGETALLQACRAGHFNVVELLLRHGADAALASQNGETALHFIISFEDADVHRAADLLIDHGAMPCFFSVVPFNCSSTVAHGLHGTPLDYAVLMRNETAAQILVSKGADPFHCDNAGSADSHSVTPFLMAITKLLPTTVKAMLHSPARSTGLGEYLTHRKCSTLMELLQTVAVSDVSWDSFGDSFVPNLTRIIDLIRTFEDSGNILLQPSKIGLPLLHACIAYGLPSPVIEHLLGTGCGKHIERVSAMRCWTPLQACIYLNRRDTFLILLNHGADIDRTLFSPHPGISYLQYCASVGSHGGYFARELIWRGATSKGLCDLKSKLTMMPQSSFAPVILALMAGALELATHFTLMEYPDGHIPQDVPILHALTSSTSRLPVSRLHHLLEPPAGLHPVPITGTTKEKKNCFHGLAVARGGFGPESFVNFRYLLQQCKSQGQDQNLLNQMDTYGMTPLTVSALLGRFELVREMLYAGANPNIGAMTCVNAGYMGLKRLRKAPLVNPDSNDPSPWTRRESWLLEKDYLSIIELSKGFGGQEPKTIASAPRVDVSKVFGGNLKVWSALSEPQHTANGEKDNHKHSQRYPRPIL
ncbi:hypothetical protein N7530_006021 [Penicillium desertorum]|uniref:Protein kinase domain-containing protein n=1 Tax=Penicillium desertorum TaxID=1303715 RepID=A0A9W9X1M1_9EURO|nr:hypothetical protein N7530_006021 [Penicillium desertorum]